MLKCACAPDAPQRAAFPIGQLNRLEAEVGVNKKKQIAENRYDYVARRRVAMGLVLFTPSLNWTVGSEANCSNERSV